MSLHHSEATHEQLIARVPQVTGRDLPEWFTALDDGPGLLRFDERVNWFPHISPDGEWIVYLSYPPGTVGHPPDKDVILRLMRPDGSERQDEDEPPSLHVLLSRDDAWGPTGRL